MSTIVATAFCYNLSWWLNFKAYRQQFSQTIGLWFLILCEKSNAFQWNGQRKTTTKRPPIKRSNAHCLWESCRPLEPQSNCHRRRRSSMPYDIIAIVLVVILPPLRVCANNSEYYIVQKIHYNYNHTIIISIYCTLRVWRLTPPIAYLGD